MFNKIFIFLFLLTFLFLDVAFASNYKNKLITRPVIILDPGHGGQHKGARIKNPFLEEKRLTLTTTLLAKKYLEQYGYKVLLTRDKDYFVPLKKRVEKANNSRAEIFVSIHFNSCPNATANGIEVYFHNSKENESKTKSSKNLATSVLNNVVKNTNAVSRGVRKSHFLVVRDTKMPSILIEAGYLTNPKERNNIKDKMYLDKISLGIAEGIEAFMKKYI